MALQLKALDISVPSWILPPFTHSVLEGQKSNSSILWDPSRAVELGQTLYFKDYIKVAHTSLSCPYGKRWFAVTLLSITVVDRILFPFPKVRM